MIKVRQELLRQVRTKWKGWTATFFTLLLLVVSGQGDFLQYLVKHLLPPEDAFGTALIELSPVFQEGEPASGQPEELLLLMNNEEGVHKTKVLETDSIHTQPKVAVGSIGDLVEATIPPRTQLLAMPVAEVNLPPDTLAAIRVGRESREDHGRGRYRYIAGDTQGVFDNSSLVLSTPNDRRRRFFVWCSLLTLATVISLSAPSFKTLRYPATRPKVESDNGSGAKIKPSEGADDKG